MSIKRRSKQTILVLQHVGNSLQRGSNMSSTETVSSSQIQRRKLIKTEKMRQNGLILQYVL